MVKKFAVVIGLAVIILLVLLVSLETTVKAEGPQPTCAISMAQNFNHVVFTTTWSGGEESGAYPFQFGDTSLPHVLTGTVGQMVLPHDYAYSVGGLITYAAGFTLVGEGGQTYCGQQVVIDDRQIQPPPMLTPTVALYLPMVANQPGPPQVNGFIVAQGENHVTIRLIWSDGFDAWHTLSWGDGSTVDLLGASGDIAIEHWYAMGMWTMEFTVTGSGGTTTWRYKVATL